MFYAMNAHVCRTGRSDDRVYLKLWALARLGLSQRANKSQTPSTFKWFPPGGAIFFSSPLDRHFHGLSYDLEIASLPC